MIPETLKEMESDPEFQLTAEKLKKLGQKQMTKEERKKRQRALDDLGVPNFIAFWKKRVSEATGTCRVISFSMLISDELLLTIVIFCIILD